MLRSKHSSICGSVRQSKFASPHFSEHVFQSWSLVCVCAHSVSRLRVPMHVLTLRLCTRLKDGFSVISLSLGFTGKILREAEKQDSNRRRRGEKEQRVKDSVRVEQVSW